jgi:hypothetical protein
MEVTEELFDDFLDNFYPMVSVGGLEFLPSKVLKELDPTAYRCYYHDWVDSLEKE